MAISTLNVVVVNGDVAVSIIVVVVPAAAVVVEDV